MSMSNNLKERIRSDYLIAGKLHVGSKLPTIRELASQYSVSPPTIGKAVELLTEEGWLNKRQGSGLYVARPSDETPSSSGQSSLRIGYMAHDLSSFLAHRALEGVARVVNNHNGFLELSSNWSVEGERRQVELMRTRGIQGVVLYPALSRTGNDEYLGREFRDFPIVVIDLYEPDMKRPHVVFDNFSAGRDMVRYLLKQGRKEIAFIKFTDMRLFRSVDDRVAGYRQALKEADIPFVPERLVAYENREDLEGPRLPEVLDKLMALNPCPNAIILPWDEIVPVAIKHLRARGVSVPDDIVVAGFDNLPLNNQLQRWPTTNPDFYRMGERAAEILFDRIASRNLEPSESMLSCPLITANEGIPFIRRRLACV
jgi:GntR family transcriptional regulator of arabinose operon